MSKSLITFFFGCVCDKKIEVEKMQPSDLRIASKVKALEILSTGDMGFIPLCVQLTEFNGWRIDTNGNILKELLLSGRVVRNGDVLRLKR